MTTADPVRIAILGGRGGSKAHWELLRRSFVPPGVELDNEPLSLWREPDQPRRQAEDAYVARAVELVREHHWDGIALTGAPNQLLYPGVSVRVRAAVDIPVTLALEASAMAARALGIRRALLLTPLDGPTNTLIKDYLATAGVEAVLPATAFSTVDQMAEAGTEEINDLAKRELASAPGVDGIIFQAARLLTPIGLLERFEQDFDRPVVASNPAILWHLLSTLGRTYHMERGGRLLREWPALPAGRVPHAK